MNILNGLLNIKLYSLLFNYWFKIEPNQPGFEIRVWSR